MNSGLLQVFPSCNSHVHAAFRWFDRAFLFPIQIPIALLSFEMSVIS
jgi:hypothetical protein